MQKVGLIIPCYNEARRFDAQGFLALAGLPDVTLVFVNDGSTDDTEAVLRRFCEGPGGDAELISFAQNRGKAEGVRRGLAHALDAGADIVGYVDADLATPTAEIDRLIETLRADVRSALLGSRVQLLGTQIERSPLRHYVGRVFGTLASLILRVPIYDTQCGAKVFRRTAALEAALADPFVSRWCFDIELLGRLLIGTVETPGLPVDEIRELPLRRWRDIPGSSLSLASAPQVVFELLRVARDLRARRAHASLRDRVRTSAAAPERANEPSDTREQ
jgi:glycosyltransferase involved in cell wall biosynthesis